MTRPLKTALDLSLVSDLDHAKRTLRAIERDNRGQNARDAAVARRAIIRLLEADDLARHQPHAYERLNR